MRGDEEFFRVQLMLLKHPDFKRWFERLEGIGGCERPIYLTGRTVVCDPRTGEILDEFSSAGQPFNRLMVPCKTRKASQCESCAWWFQGDTFHVILAGLVGGKGVPETVRSHPRVFLTLTAPSLGPVHTRVLKDGSVLPCRPRHRVELCPHGVDVSCSALHGEDDPVLGSALCPQCFDYVGAVLWNAHAGKLWHRFTDDVRRITLPERSGLSAKAFASSVRVSFAKVAEYQRRGLVHFHAVVRLDGPDGPEGGPPGWAGVESLMEALRSSAARVRVECPDEGEGTRVLVFGEQIDVKPIQDTGSDGGTLRDEQVAGYVAKYATKATESVGALDRSIVCRDCGGSGLFDACPRCGGTGLRVPLEDLPVTEHVRALVAAAWRLGGLCKFLKPDLHLRRWAHQSGFGGHFSTRSRLYSVTLGELRQERADYAAGHSGHREALPAGAVVLKDWEYAGSGLSDVEAAFARQVREHIAFSREEARWELPRIRAEEQEARAALAFALEHETAYAAQVGDPPDGWNDPDWGGDEP